MPISIEEYRNKQRELLTNLVHYAGTVGFSLFSWDGDDDAELASNSNHPVTDMMNAVTDLDEPWIRFKNQDGTQSFTFCFCFDRRSPVTEWTCDFRANTDTAFDFAEFVLDTAHHKMGM